MTTDDLASYLSIAASVMGMGYILAQTLIKKGNGGRSRNKRSKIKKSLRLDTLVARLEMQIKKTLLHLVENLAIFCRPSPRPVLQQS